MWRTQFEDAYEWLYLEDVAGIETNFVLQPAGFRISNRMIYADFPESIDLGSKPEVRIYSLAGQLALQSELRPDIPVNLPIDLKGIFIINITASKMHFSKKVLLF